MNKDNNEYIDDFLQSYSPQPLNEESSSSPVDALSL